MADEAASAKSKSKFGISFNAPVILVFAILCTAATGINYATNGAANLKLFSVYRAGSSLRDPFTYIRFIGHVFGHSDWNHLLSNMMYLFLIGPMLEEKYSHKPLIVMMICTALLTGFVQFVFFPESALLGASGIIFAMIILSSITGDGKGGIPLTFIIVAAIFIGKQIYEGVVVADNISHLTHILGGIVGAIAGFKLRK